MARQYIKQQYSQAWGQKSGYLDKDVVIKIAPAPIKGWDALSPIAAMEPQYAVVLDNWVPRTGYCELRGGSNIWSQGLGAGGAPNINSLMVYRPAGGSEKMFAASAPYIYDVSTQGAPSTSVIGISSDKFQYINFTPSGGSNYLYLVNGSDPALIYNGTTWTLPTITGVTSSTLIGITSFKRRIWFVQKNSTAAWYLGTDAIQGAATKLDLGAFMTKGGYLVAVATWTVDGGQGPDDYIVFITNRGQYIVYKGTDPDNAAAWSIIGTFDNVPPIGYRCVVRFGSDDLVITTQGVIPLSQALPFDPAASRSVAITNRIQNAMLQAAQAYSSNFGWELISFPSQALLILNVPTYAGFTAVQYVMNTVTGAWCSFSGWNANCFAIFNDSLYFGAQAGAGLPGSVYIAYAGASDLSTNISARMSTAFNYYDEPGRVKNANLCRPFFLADGTIVPNINVDSDFLITVPTNTASGFTSGSLWDVALWDTAIWGDVYINVINWLSVNALGTALSINLAVNLQYVTSTGLGIFDTGVFDSAVFDGTGVYTSGSGIPILRVATFEIALENGGPV